MIKNDRASTLTSGPRGGALRALAALAMGLAPLASPAPATAQETPSAIAQAVLPLPASERPAATVLDRSGRVLRDGAGAFICLTDAEAEGFGVACYHDSLEPYMARGRALAASGVTGRESIQTRWEEIEAGELEMPRHPAVLYQLFGDTAPSGGDISGLSRLTVIYVAYQDAASIGLPEAPADGLPWLMFPGRPTAHIMIGG